MTDVTFTAYDPTRRDAYLDLLRAAWGDDAMSGETFDWWFDGNPAGSLMSVALLDGAVVGAASHSLCRLVVGGRDRLGQFSLHAVTAPAARGLGVFRGLERRHEEQGAERGSTAAFCFASAPVRPLFLGPLGWSQIDLRRVWGRPLRGLARRVLRRAPGGPMASSRDRSETTRIDTFDVDTDRAYAALAPQLRNHVIRDSRYLNWRYVESPRDYRCFRSANGFAVVGHATRRGASLALLMELVAPAAEVRALVRRCVAEASRGADLLLAVPSPLLPRRTLATLGFLPTPTRLDLVGKGLVDPLDTRSERWCLSLGDTDFF